LNRYVNIDFLFYSDPLRLIYFGLNLLMELS